MNEMRRNNVSQSTKACIQRKRNKWVVVRRNVGFTLREKGITKYFNNVLASASEV